MTDDFLQFELACNNNSRAVDLASSNFGRNQLRRSEATKRRENLEMLELNAGARGGTECLLSRCL
jgi:hypothetical protein